MIKLLILFKITGKNKINKYIISKTGIFMKICFELFFRRNPKSQIIFFIKPKAQIRFALLKLSSRIKVKK